MNAPANGKGAVGAVWQVPRIIFHLSPDFLNIILSSEDQFVPSFLDLAAIGRMEEDRRRKTL